MIFFFNGWWYDGEFEPEVSTILGEKYNPDEWTLEDALADIKEKYCPGGFDWNEDHWGVEGYGKTFTITIGDEEELALTAMYTLPPAPDTKVEYSILDESAKTCAITHVGVDYFNDEVTAFEIPETVELEGGTYTVTAIGDNAFNGCRNMASVTIPNTVTSIGRRAFYFVEKSEGGLTQITIPNSVTSIGEESFYGCRYLETVTLSENITSIPNGCFCDCWNLKNINSEDGVEIPSGVTSIGGNAFRNCQYQLAKVTIPDGVTYIGDYAFYSCHQLTSISVPGTVEFVGSTAFPTYSDDNLTFIEKNGVKYLGYTDGEATHCVVLIDGKSYSGEYTVESDCKFIYNSAFHGNNNITKVIIPGGCAIKGIGDDAFNNCHMLASINIPEGVTCVGNKAFYRCQRIQEMNIPSTIKTIGEDAFTFAIYDNEYATLGQELYSQEGNGLYLGNSQNPCLCLAKPVSGDIAELEISSRCKFILTEALKGCANLINLDVPESVTSIGNNAFADGIININYSGTPEDNKWGALYRNTPVTGDFLYADEDETEITKYIGSSEVVNVPAGVTAIGEEAFRGRSVTSVNLPDGVVTIGKSAFSNCAELSSMILPSTVESIGDYAFSNCEGMHSVYLPEGLKSVGQYAFQGCKSLVSVVVPSTVERMGFYAFNKCNENIVIFCMRDKEPEDLDYNTPWNRLWNGGYEENYGDIKYNVVWRQNPEGSGFESDNIYCSNDGLLYFIYRYDYDYETQEETTNIEENKLKYLTSTGFDDFFNSGDAILIGYRGNRSSDGFDLAIPGEIGDDSKARRHPVVAVASCAFYGETIATLSNGVDDGSKAANPIVGSNLRLIGDNAFCQAQIYESGALGNETDMWYVFDGEEETEVEDISLYLADYKCGGQFYRKMSFIYVKGGDDERGDGVLGTKKNAVRSLAEAETSCFDTDGDIEYVIFVMGELSETQTLSQKLITSNPPSGMDNFDGCHRAKSVTICGDPESGVNVIDAGWDGISEPSKPIGPALTNSACVPVVIKNLTIKGGYAEDGGGIYSWNDYGATDLTIADGAIITTNKATNGGGGIYVGGAFKMTGGEISSNIALYGGGIYIYNGTAGIIGGSINQNHSNTDGGGVYAFQYGVVTIGGDAVISENEAVNNGGGFCVSEGRGNYLALLTGNAEIRENMAESYGGGVYVATSSEFTMDGGSISGNTDGGGVYLTNGDYGVGTFKMSGGVISGNQDKFGEDDPVSLGVYVSGAEDIQAVFEMSGTAKVDQSNYVELGQNAVIKVTEELDCEDNEIVATITPYSYDEDNLQVVSTDASLDLDYADSHFAITPDSESNTYHLVNGYMVKD